MSATCKTCGGIPPYHKPSLFDQDGVGHPDHKVDKSSVYRDLMHAYNKAVELDGINAPKWAFGTKTIEFVEQYIQTIVSDAQVKSYRAGLNDRHPDMYTRQELEAAEQEARDNLLHALWEDIKIPVWSEKEDTQTLARIFSKYGLYKDRK